MAGPTSISQKGQVGKVKKKDIERLIELDERIKELVVEYGLMTTETIFEIVPAQRVLEGMSYMFPNNFSHWTFGRDYERNRTIYEHTGQGIPYEQVWNFDVPRALLVETNPLTLNAIIVAHVYGHVDFFLGSRYLQHGRSFSDISGEAKNAARRFAEYEIKYGEEVEKIIDAGMSIMWHQHPDPLFEEPDEEVLRENIMTFERAKAERFKGSLSDFKNPDTKQQIARIEEKLRFLEIRTPPEPTYDLLGYITRKSMRPLKPWMVDVLTVLRNQARCLAPNGRTKMLNEGWASYWHVKIMRRLFEEEGLLTAEEHDIFNHFHSGVTRESKKSFNWYRIGLALFNYIEEKWDKGQFGREYEESEDPFKRSKWDTGAKAGQQKIFEIRSFYTDRMAVEEFFTDEFIRSQNLYIYESLEDRDGTVTDIIVEDNPIEIRKILKMMMSSHGPQIIVTNGNYKNNGHLLLRHIYTGYDLDPEYRDATLAKIHYLWGRKVFIEAIEDGKPKEFSYDGNSKKKQ